MDVAHLLNSHLRSNPMYQALAEAFEDLLNVTVGTATNEAMNAIGNPYSMLRGDKIDPRNYPDIEAVTDGGVSYAEMLSDRSTAANVHVVMPTDDQGSAQIYMELDGVTYVASGSQFHDRDLLVREAKYLGFDFFSDDLTDADYARILLFINQYWPRSGSHKSLANFLGFIRNIRIDLVQLWTVDDGLADYDVLERLSNSMTPIWEGGKHYPTFSYDMHYDAFADTDINELRRLFFAMAPIHLVLRRMVETVRSQATAYGAAAPLINNLKPMFWAPQKATKSQHIKYRFVTANINIPMAMVPPNLDPSGIAIAAMGVRGVWILERDPSIASPSAPVTYMLEHGLYIPPSTDPSKRVELPHWGVWNSGIWVMSDTADVSCVIEIT